MKYIYIYLSIFILSSCSVDQLLTDGNLDDVYTYTVDHNDHHLKATPIDKSLYSYLVDKGIDEECAYTSSYNRSNVLCQRILPGKDHRQFINFKSVDAYYIADTLQLVFSTATAHEGKERSKLLIVKIHDNDYTVDMVHGSTIFREVYQLDGSIQTEPTVKSHVRSKHLSLNKDFYQVGDEIKGEIKVRSLLRHPIKGKTDEYILGNFRATVLDYTSVCNTDITGL